MQTNEFLEQIFATLRSSQPIPHLFKERLNALIKTEVFKKGHVLLQAGKRARKVWFLNDGFAQESAHENNSVRISWFYFSGDFLLRYPLFFSELPAFRNIELITECVISEITYKDLILLRNEFNETNLFIDTARGNCEMEREKHSADLQLLTAKERFDCFYLDHKPLFNIAKHKDIASFLGIKTDGFRRYNR